MARLEVTTGEGGITVRVTLSRRNLLALLHKLDVPGSKREILNNDCWINAEQAPWPGLELVLRSEDDDEHYARRPAPPGQMHPATEAFIAGEQEPACPSGQFDSPLDCPRCRGDINKCPGGPHETTCT